MPLQPPGQISINQSWEMEREREEEETADLNTQRERGGEREKKFAKKVFLQVLLIYATGNKVF